jgi:hypothetical protein
MNSSNKSSSKKLSKKKKSESSKKHVNNSRKVGRPKSLFKNGKDIRTTNSPFRCKYITKRGRCLNNWCNTNNALQEGYCGIHDKIIRKTTMLLK